MSINRVPAGVPSGGEFSEGRRGETGAATLTGPAARPSETDLADLPYLVPDLSGEQQAETGLPPDFDQAYDEYFTEADEALERHDGDVEAAAAEFTAERDERLAALERSFPQAGGSIKPHVPQDPYDMGWYLDDAESDGKITAITYSDFEREDGGFYQTDGPTLTTKGAKGLR